MICVIASAGGHLTEVLKATRLLRGYKMFYVTYCLPHVRESLQAKEFYCVVDPHYSLFKYLWNFLQALVIFVKKRPKIILSTGSGIAVPMCYIGKLFGSKVVFIESACRVQIPSRSGRAVYPIADLFIVQWESLLSHYPKAVYGGSLI